MKIARGKSKKSAELRKTDLLKDLVKETQLLIEDTRRSIQKFDEIYLGLSKKMEEHKRYLKEIADSNHVLDETVGNVLLAIRQNEYLQAYYPEQHGFKEMKVVGRHPSRTTKPKMHNELLKEACNV